MIRLTESDIVRIVRRVINENEDLPGGIVKRKITDFASAKRYAMGTKVSAELIMKIIERGGDVFMYTDRSSDKIFIDTLTKQVYDQLDRRIGKVTGYMDDWAMDYFDDNKSLPSGIERSWTPELIRQEFINGDYTSRRDLEKKNPKLYFAARKRGMLDELIPYRFQPSWTPELIRQEFENGDYTSRRDLKIKNPKLYDAARRYGMLDELM
jgi:hypothetical protein